MKTNQIDFVIDDIESKIISDEYPAGTRIPTIVELMDIYNISRTSSQKVINTLYDKDYVIKKVKKGTFVRPFIKEKLFNEKMSNLKNDLKQILMYYEKIGIEKEQIKSIIDDL